MTSPTTYSLFSTEADDNSMNAMPLCFNTVDAEAQQPKNDSVAPMVQFVPVMVSQGDQGQQVLTPLPMSMMKMAMPWAEGSMDGNAIGWAPAMQQQQQQAQAPQDRQQRIHKQQHPQQLQPPPQYQHRQHVQRNKPIVQESSEYPQMDVLGRRPNLDLPQEQWQQQQQQPQQPQQDRWPIQNKEKGKPMMSMEQPDQQGIPILHLVQPRAPNVMQGQQQPHSNGLFLPGPFEPPTSGWTPSDDQQSNNVVGNLKHVPYWAIQHEEQSLHKQMESLQNYSDACWMPGSGAISQGGNERPNSLPAECPWVPVGALGRIGQHKGMPPHMPSSGGRAPGNVMGRTGQHRQPRGNYANRNNLRERGMGNMDNVSNGSELLAGTGEAPQVRRNRGPPSRGMQRDGTEGRQMGSVFPDSGADTMKAQLQALQNEDPSHVFIARRINKLGFSSADQLRVHFSQYGEVKNVYVSHSRVKSLKTLGRYRNLEESPGQSHWRLRAAALGFIVMASAEATSRIINGGPEHQVNGVIVRVNAFHRRVCEENEGAENASNAEDYGISLSTASPDRQVSSTPSIQDLVPGTRLAWSDMDGTGDCGVDSDEEDGFGLSTGGGASYQFTQHVVPGTKLACSDAQLDTDRNKGMMDSQLYSNFVISGGPIVYGAKEDDLFYASADEFDD